MSVCSNPIIVCDRLQWLALISAVILNLWLRANCPDWQNPLANILSSYRSCVHFQWLLLSWGVWVMRVWMSESHWSNSTVQRMFRSTGTFHFIWSGWAERPDVGVCSLLSSGGESQSFPWECTCVSPSLGSCSVMVVLYCVIDSPRGPACCLFVLEFHCVSLRVLVGGPVSICSCC